MTHAFPAAIAARDADALIATLAPDVVLHSAVTAGRFEGRDVVADTYRSVLESFEELRIVDEFESGHTHAFFWEGRMEGRYVAGADRIRLDAGGKVRRDHRGRPPAVRPRNISDRNRPAPRAPPARRPRREAPEDQRATAASAVLGPGPNHALDPARLAVSGPPGCENRDSVPLWVP